MESDNVIQRHIEAFLNNRPSCLDGQEDEDLDLDLCVQLIDDFHADVDEDRAQWVQLLKTKRQREKLVALEETDEEITNIKSEIEECQANVARIQAKLAQAQQTLAQAQAKLPQAQRKRKKIMNNTDEEAREGALGGGTVSSIILSIVRENVSLFYPLFVFFATQ
jgi:multidrug efflux pump subunit AcrA (membrane-fusion protein)